MHITPYHSKYFACELTRRRSADDLSKFTASLQDAQVDLNPHQVEAALFAFQSPLSKGAILADEVGLGKTIEAGIILSQRWAERKRNLLIICPSNLRKQWSQELADKFYLPSLILESKSFNAQIKAGKENPFEQADIVLCSFQFARSKENFVKAIPWDLVIIDEAHRLRNVYKPSNKIGNSIKESLKLVHKVLLTATPLQNSLQELYGLVSIVDDYIFGDVKSFKEQFSRLTDEDSYQALRTRIAPLCQRTLRRQVGEYINYTNRIAIVEEFYPYPEETELYDLVSEYLQRPLLFALPAGQRQLMTLILRKLLASSTYAIHATLEGLAQKLEARLQKHETITLQGIGEDFETLDELQEDWDEEENNEVDAEYLSPQQIEDIKIEISDLKRFYQLAVNISKNSKGEKLFTALEKGFEKLKDLGATQKAIIFTESTRTQKYLKNILEEGSYTGKVVLFNGSNNDPESKRIYNDWLATHRGTDRISGSPAADMRQALVDYFKNTATILIATEAAAEGINLQFCSLVVNYDLPWNPQRIEQRIGRCHRYGQKYDVVVVNFLNKSNAADERVYQLLDEKFRLFDGVFGASDEVLGSIESGVDFEKRIARIYQECRKPEEIQKAFDDLQRSLEPEIENRLDNTRQKLMENFDEEVHRKLRINLEKGKEYLNQYEQWLWQITRYYLQAYADFDDATDSFQLHTNPFPDDNIHSGPYRILRASAERKKSEITLADDTNVYRVGHPLAQRIIETCRTASLPEQEVVFNYTGTPIQISILKEFVGQAGWLQVSLYTVTSFEKEEFLLFSGFTDAGTDLDTEMCQKLFSLFASEGFSISAPQEVLNHCATLDEIQRQTHIATTMSRNNDFFDRENDKLERWAEDMKLSLEKEIQDLDAQIKLRKAEAHKLTDLRTKLNEQRAIKDLEKTRNEKRRTLYEAQDKIDEKKELLLTDIERRLSQQTMQEQLFLIRWKLI